MTSRPVPRVISIEFAPSPGEEPGPPSYQCWDCQMREAVSVAWGDDGNVVDAVCKGCARKREAAAGRLETGSIIHGRYGDYVFYRGYYAKEL